MKMKDRHYKSLMSRYRSAQDDTAREEIRQEIWKIFGQKRATLVTDMSGFTYLSHRYGSIHYLSMIEMMEEVITQVVEEHEGTVVKCEADNTFCIFENPKCALEASLVINKALDIKNLELEEKFQVSISCGIAYGSILVLENEIYGQSVIIASKLGEDIAKRGEILVSKDCFDIIDDQLEVVKTAVTLDISKVEVACFYVTTTTA